MRTEASEIQVNLVFCCSAHESSHSIFEDIVDTDQFRWVFVARIACRTAHLSLPLLQGKWPIVKNDALMRNHRVVRTSTWKEESPVITIDHGASDTNVGRIFPSVT